MKSPYNLKIIAAAALLVAAAGIGWWLMPKSIAPEDRYIIATIKRGSIAQIVSANGALNPVRLVSVGSQVSGIVKKLYVDFNDQVKAGQILLELDPALTEAQLQQTEASVLSAEASLDLARSNEERARTLFAQDFVSRQEMDQSVQALKLAQAQLAVARAQAARDRTNRVNTVIRSPISGVVVSREVDLGQTVAASFTAPILFKIAQDLSKMQIDSSYSEADIGKIRVGQVAIFRVDAFADKEFQGVVRQVRLNPSIEQNVVTYDVVIAVDNPEMILMPGMTAYVSINTAQRDDALLVPNAALRFRPVDPIYPTEKSRVDSKKTDSKTPENKVPENKITANKEPEIKKPEGKKKAVELAEKVPVQGVSSTIYVLENGQPKPIKIITGITDNRHTEVISGELSENIEVILDDKLQSAKKPVTGGMRFF